MSCSCEGREEEESRKELKRQREESRNERRKREEGRISNLDTSANTFLRWGTLVLALKVDNTNQGSGHRSSHIFPGHHLENTDS
jgi:hypothetical protein